jgi:hypothetical protein
MRLADQFEDMGMMGQAIQKCGSQAFTAKDLYPVSEFQIGRNNQREPFVKFRAEGKESVCAIGRKGDEAESL